jgi:hypothetical protein
MANQTIMQKHLEWLKARMVITKMEIQLLEEEKQQIIDAFDGFPLSTRNSQNGEEYYTETYKSKNK